MLGGVANPVMLLLRPSFIQDLNFVQLDHL
uniref:Uncharacterized protein n=1 Tax=virus sp. ctx9V1 TaxID=2828001 RepID=A0A8S5RDX7_9VIRU|nr:MAG TPA: hypothetical protein [virus sp. ctx9V1]